MHSANSSTVLGLHIRNTALHQVGLDICRGGPQEHANVFLFSPMRFLPKIGPLSSGTQLSHLPRGCRVRRLTRPQASRCSQPPENPQHWGQGSHHVDDHPLGPQHWGQGSHHVADHPLGPPATSSGSRFCNDRARGSGLVSSSGYLVGALFGGGEHNRPSLLSACPVDLFLRAQGVEPVSHSLLTSMW